MPSATSKTNVDAMILAAGRGQRMRPLSDITPKPLLRPGGASAPMLIEYHLQALASCGFSRVIINCAWLSEQLMEALGDGTRYGLTIRYSVEKEGALGTGGAIVHALPLMQGARLLLLSGDVWSDFALSKLLTVGGACGAREDGNNDDNDGCLVLVDNPSHHRHGDFYLDNNRVHSDDGDVDDDASDARDLRLTYSGLSVLKRDLFAQLKPGYYALAPILHKAARAGRIAGIHHRGRWLDAGTPQRLVALQKILRA